MREVIVLYRTAKGVMAFDRKKPIFQHRNSTNLLDVGLGVINQESFVDKDRCAFAEMQNVFSVFPSCYLQLDYFENIGVPHKILRGSYGQSIFLKEFYRDRVRIVAFDESGKVLLQECEFLKNGLLNVYYARLNNVIPEWEDISEFVFSSLVTDLKNRPSDLNLSNPYILYVLKNLRRHAILKTDSGVILAHGKYETLAIWGHSNCASMAWLGRRVDDFLSGEVITPQVENHIKQVGIL